MPAEGQEGDIAGAASFSGTVTLNDPVTLVATSGATTRIGVTTAPANLGIQFTGSYTHTIQVDSGVTFTVPFTINIASLNGASPGSAASFTNTQGYTNKIATASGGVSGFASNKFSVVTGNFANAMNGGTWSIRQSGNDLELVFAPNQGLSPATVIKFR